MSFFCVLYAFWCIKMSVLWTIGEELYEFQSQVLYSTRDSDDGSASMICPEGEVLAGDDPHLFCRGESKITTGKVNVLILDYLFMCDVLTKLHLKKKKEYFSNL